MAAASTAAIPPAMLPASTGTARKRGGAALRRVAGLNAFGGLKAHNAVSALGATESTQQRFARVVRSLAPNSAGVRKDNRGGGALSARCNAAAEIFKIAAIMNGLVLVGVALGFALIWMENLVEESESR